MPPQKKAHEHVKKKKNPENSPSEEASTMWRGLVLVWAFFSVVASQPVTGKETPTVFLHAATKILLDTLPGTRGRPFTLFVPNDDAFESAGRTYRTCESVESARSNIFFFPCTGVDVNELSAEEITNGVMSHFYVGGALTPGDLNGSATVKVSCCTFFAQGSPSILTRMA